MSNHPDDAAKYAALHVIWVKTNFQKDKKTAEVLLKLLNSNVPHIESQALYRLIGKTYALPNKGAIKVRVFELMFAKDPGVRGRAVYLASEMATDDDKEKVGNTIHSLLDDKNAFVRSIAAMGLVKLKRVKSIHKLMTMLPDKEAQYV